MKKITLFRLFLLAFILLAFFLSLYTFRAPKPEPMNLVQEKFSVDRAFEHVKEIAQKPHSMATDEHERVRNYLVQQLTQLGIETEVQSTTSMYDFRGGVSAGYVHNVIGFLKGREGKKSILVTAHYDSQPHTLGAADDGAAVAAILESARALTEYPSLKNNVIFLFSDGEEAALFGAKAFAEQHPLMKDVALVLNLESRGTKGPSYTYEVSNDNGWIMREYAKAVSYPIASSLAYEVYKLMPNNSDFTIYKNLGYSGFNTAFIESFVDYHSMTDSPEKLSLRSLQHHGTYIMDIVKHFGELDLSNTKADDLVFFNWMGHFLIYYPQILNMWMILIISLLFVFVVILGVRNKELVIWKALVGIAVFLISAALALGATWLLQTVIPSFYPWYENFDASNFYNVGYYFMAFGAICVFFVSLVYAILYKKLGTLNLWTGVLFLNIVLAYFIQIYIPTALFISIVPLFLMLAVLLVKFLMKIKSDRFIYLFLIGLLSFPVITLYMPFVKILYITFGLSLAVGGSLVFVLLLTYLLPVLEHVFKLKRWILPSIAFLAIGVSLFIAHAHSDYNEEQPYTSDLLYCQNAQTNKSMWVSNSLYLDRWKKQYFSEALLEPLTEVYPNTMRTRLKNEAPYVEIPKPEITIYSDSTDNGYRYVHLNVCSNQNAENAQFLIHQKAAIETLKINDYLVSDSLFYHKFYGGYYYFNFYGIYSQGIDLKLKCKAGSDIELIMVEKKIGLPSVEGFEKMPAYIVPRQGYFSNMTVLRTDWKF